MATLKRAPVVPISRMMKWRKAPFILESNLNIKFMKIPVSFLGKKKKTALIRVETVHLSPWLTWTPVCSRATSLNVNKISLLLYYSSQPG